METGFLVATQLSSLFPSQATSIPLQTSRQGIPLPAAPSESDPPAEHAIYSVVLHTPTTGTILLRVLHGGLIVELISLSTEVPPIRFVFPGAVVSSPAVFLWETSELHVLAIADTGSLFRLVIPIGNGRDLWHNQAANVWPREYLLKTPEDVQDALVHVQSTHCVVLGLPNGSLLRLENEYIGEDSDDEWTETVFQHSSFLSSLTSFLPLGSSNASGSTLISIATHPWPTDIGHVWTLSRDRTLRFWKAKIGCVASKVLSAGKESSPSPGSSTNGNKPHVLLDGTPQTLLRVFSSPFREDHIFVVVFIPTISSPTSGGTFHLLDTVGDTMYEAGKIEATGETAHCHLQDFIVVGNLLVALWDRQGQSMVQKTVMNIQNLQEGFRPAPWTTSCYAPEPELTPAYLEELLLSPGSMTDKFFEAIIRPGMFSALTLRTAIDQYTEACLSMPGPRPPQLATTYATISEHIAAVIGCTVDLNRDPQTGAYQHASYWSALKRDWEGFIARCREVERSARRPLGLGSQDQDDIIVVERERVGSLVGEDLPIFLQRVLSATNFAVEPQYELLATLWTLKGTLGPQVMLSLESRMLDIVHQEVAFSIPDILQDQTRRFNFREEMDEGSMHWIIGRLQGIEDLDAATRLALDIIGGFDVEVKLEEDEVELLLPPPNSDWSRALAAAYISKSIDARYEVALSLVTLLFFLSDEISDWDPTLLAEIFAVFRGIAMLRYVARQPAGPAANTPPASSEQFADDVVSRMRNMNVSHGSQSHLSPTYSLIHRLLAQSGDTHGLPAAAHRFLDSTGLLQSISPATTTQFEILFCERLRLLGFYEASRELLSWLPRTAGASYALARLWLDIGRIDDASHLFEKLAGSFAGIYGGEHSLSAEDQESLARILPATELLHSQYFFYIHVSTLFKLSGWVHYEVLFAQLAISVAPPNSADTSSLWATVITGFSELALYEDAYAALMATPYEKLKRECVSQLAYRMCEDNAVERLMTFNFAGILDEVQDALAFKARNVDPRVHPSYSRILYTWFIRRGDYRNASLAMYQRAKKLQDLINDPTSFVSLAEEQLEAYNIAINALSLVDQKNAWVLLPLPGDHEPRKRRKLSRHIPDHKFSSGRFDADIVPLADMQYDYALLAAQIDMTRYEPTLLSSPEFLLSPPVIVLRLAQANRFNQAMAAARSLKVDMTDLFSHLTGQCLRLSRNPDTVTQEDTSDWLLTDKVSSWPGTPADRGWRYLRQSLQQHDSADTDYKYTKATLETILGADNSSSPPPWLIHILEDHHHEYLIRISLRFDNLEAAIEHTLSLMRKSDSRLARDAPKNACSTWLPYTLIDQVLIAAAQASSTPRLSALRSEIAGRVKRMQKLSQFSR